MYAYVSYKLLQLALKFKDASASDQPLDNLETKQNDAELTDIGTISLPVHKLFLCLVDQIAELLQSVDTLELIQSCENLKASNFHFLIFC